MPEVNGDDKPYRLERDEEEYYEYSLLTQDMLELLLASGLD